jgi:hypothetical protein
MTSIEQSAAAMARYVAELEGRVAELEAERDRMRAEVVAARELWAHLKDLRDPWGEYQDAYVGMGLLKRVAIPAGTPEEERCEDCDGECEWCYHDSGVIGPLPTEGGR